MAFLAKSPRVGRQDDSVDESSVCSNPRIRNPLCGRRELTPTNCPLTPCVPCVHSGAHAQRINKMQCHFFFCLKCDFKTSLDTLVRLSDEARWYMPVIPTCKKERLEKSRVQDHPLLCRVAGQPRPLENTSQKPNR